MKMVEIKTTLFDSKKIRASSAIANYKPKRGVHHHTHHEILIIEKGSGTHLIDDTCYEVKNKQIFFLRPGQSHQFCPDAGSIFYFVAIDQKGILRNTVLNLNDLAYFQRFTSKAFICVEQIDNIKLLVTSIEKALLEQGQFPNSALLISSYMSVLLLEIQRLYLQQHSGPNLNYSPIVASFNALLESEYTSRFVKDYAKKLFVSANYLNECVRKETHQPASFWLQVSILNKAKRLLRTSNKTVNEIAEACTFPNATHFTRFFKKQTSYTPREFRLKDKH